MPLEGEAQAVAERLPELLLDALRVANTVAHGIHGRRRAGPGETFWQFRQFTQASDPATVIDWRRSASSDTLYVREREWEAAHTFWLWPDVSPSMAFQSHLARSAKRDRAVVLTLAMAELLVRAGERIALLGLTAADGEPQGGIAHRPIAGRPRARRGGAVEPAAAGAPVALFQRPAVWRLPRSARADRPQVQRDGRGRCRRPRGADPGPRGGNLGLPRPHGVSLARKAASAGSRTAWRPCGRPTSASSPSIAPASKRSRAASAGRSWCITPIDPPPSRCSP